MPTKLLNRLITEYPEIKFQPNRHFKWSPDTQVLFYNLSLKNAPSLLLHELSHALLEHDNFQLDVELVHKERIAWQHAQTKLAPRYGVMITDETIEDAMDSYRIWLHERSLCPECHTSTLQTKTGTYKCLACQCQWRANDAREQSLRRYRLVSS